MARSVDASLCNGRGSRRWTSHSSEPWTKDCSAHADGIKLSVLGCFPKDTSFFLNSATTYSLQACVCHRALSSSDLPWCCPNRPSGRACCEGWELTTILAPSRTRCRQRHVAHGVFSSQGDFQQEKLSYALCPRTNGMRNGFPRGNSSI